MAQQPKATFYVFANFSPLLSISNIKNDVELIEFFRDMCNKGAAQIGVACVPGSAFGLMPDAMFVRFSCAVDVEALMTAFDVIDEAISLLTSTNK
jgi:aspartate/methionine/tyrosine aminotransferase